MKEIHWTVYALDACQSLIDSSMFWDSKFEEEILLLKRARTMAGKAIELERLERKELSNDQQT